MEKRHTWPTLAIVVATVAIVLAPVFVPREASRWYLAAAANAYRAGDDDLAERYLSRAQAWDADIKEDGDYWVTQLSRQNWQSTDEQLDLLEKIVGNYPRWARQALEVADLRVEEFDFQRAVRALKIALGGAEPKRADVLNLLAYYRSLAGIELDQALKDINRAIELAGPEPAFLDTKAWVLHGLRRDLEALPVINEAVQATERQLGLAEKESQSAEAAADEEETAAQLEHAKAFEPTSMWPSLDDVRHQIQAAKKRLGQEKWSLAVMRFHRMRIYEAVGGRPEAQQDRRWLREHQVPIIDEVF